MNLLPQVMGKLYSNFSRFSYSINQRLQYRFSSIVPNKHDTPSLRDSSSLKVLLKKFGELTSKKERLSVSFDFTANGHDMFVIPSSETGQVTYGVVRTNCYTSAAEYIHSVLKEYDTDNEFVRNLCSSRCDKLNFEDSLLCSRALVTIDEKMYSTSLLGNLQSKLYREMENKIYIYPWDILYYIKILYASNKLDYEVVRLIRKHLFNHLGVYKLRWLVRLSGDLSWKTENADVVLYQSLKSIFLSLPNQYRKYYLQNFLKLSLIEQQYCSIFFQSMKEILLSAHFRLSCNDTKLLNLILGYCIRWEIYDEVLFDRLVQLILIDQPMDNFVKLASSLFSKFRLFNYKSKMLLEEVIEIVEKNFEKTPSFYRFYKKILLYCMYLNVPHPYILRRFLTNDMQDQQAYYDIDSEWSRIYPEFLVWLCIENSHLGYAKYTDIANCQSYPYHINHIHEKYMMKYITKPAVKVSYNLLCDNLISTLTGGFYQKNALTVSNHRIDFEILLGKDEEFIDFPSFLRNIPYDYGIMRIHGISKKDTSSPIDEEKDNDDGNKLRSSKFCLHHNVQHESVNFASDWGKYLQNDSEQMPCIWKKIAIICFDHNSGTLEVRVRQLEAMGWSVVSIPEQEWKYVTKDCTSKSRAMEAQLNYFIDKIASVLKV